MEDKRKYRRFRLNVTCELTFDNNGTSPIPVSVTDASSGGMGLLSTADVGQGTLVTLTFSRPAFAPAGTVSIKGRIMGSRRKPTQPGKFILNLAYEDHDQNLVQQLLRWAQMHALVQSKAKANALSRTSGAY